MSYITGWANAVDIDLTAQGSQTIATDGSYSIAGYTWTKYNSANDSVAMALTNGTGLVVQPNNSSSNYDMNGSGRTTPLLGVTLTQIIPGFHRRMGARIWAYISAENNAANFDQALCGFDIGTGSISYLAGRGNGVAANPGINAQTFLSSSSSTSFYGIAETIGAANNVLVVEVPELGRPIQRTLFGSFGTTWPAYSALTDALTSNTTGTNANLSGLTEATAALFLGAMRFQSATALSVTFARVRVDYKF